MTVKVNEGTTIALIDGTQIAVRPLKISLLRDFMKKFEEIAKVADNNDKSMDVLIECVQIAMKQFNPELAADAKALEDNLDLPTVYKIVEEASGLQLSETSIASKLGK
jgi:inhibitor of KinA sporulation pathway (predicted exonuclease)